MEQITKRDGIYYYGGRKCLGVCDAYTRFREDYHRGLGKRVHKRLDRLGWRTERVHGFGFVFADGRPGVPACHKGTRIPYRILGLVGLSYCRILGQSDIPCVSDEDFERWVDWAFSRGSGALRLVGRKDGTGRTSRRLRKRYR
jgi:hypothetical protein